MQLRLFLVLFTTLLYFPKTYAEDNELSFSKNLITSVSKSAKWQKLIKFEDSGLLQSSEFSIHSQSFYFSDLSTLTAKSELIKTLQAFLSNKHYDDVNENPQCRFPARYIWLKEQFDLSVVEPAVCQKFLDWSKLSTTQSLSMIFATGYLGNPASYYGHTLLKLNSQKNTHLGLLETSVNFGADIPEDADPLSYMFNGVFGRYDASFTHSKFYFHTQNYLENELRDLWEYQLNLDRDDYIFLVAHIWELIEQDYIYYFFDENCVLRMYELFTLIDDIELTNINAPWVIPQEVIRAINSSTYKKLPLVKKIKYIPSRQTNFYNKYWQLTPKAKLLVEKIVANNDQLALLQAEYLTEDIKFKILSVLLDYYQYLIAVDKDNEFVHKQSYSKVISYRYKLPIGKAKFTKHTPSSPHVARPSSYLQLSLLQNKKLGDGVNFKLRPAYYDQLDAESGHVKNGALKMGELDLEYTSSKLSIRNLSLFEVVSVKNQASGLPQDNYSSWRLYLGLRKQDDSCDSCTDLTFQANKGWAIPVSDSLTFGAYLGGTVTENFLDRGRVYLSSNLTINQTINDKLNFLIDVEGRKYIENKQITKLNYRGEARYKFTLNNNYLDFRLSMSKNETMISLGYYW